MCKGRGVGKAYVADGVESVPVWLEIGMKGLDSAGNSFISLLFLQLCAWCSVVLQCLHACHAYDSKTRSLGSCAG